MCPAQAERKSIVGRPSGRTRTTRKPMSRSLPSTWRRVGFASPARTKSRRIWAQHSGTEPVASVIAGVLSGWNPERDAAGQLVGGTLHVGDRAVRLGLWEVEVISYAAGRG